MALSFNESLLCSICIELLNDATTLDCGHSYCTSCITEYWDNQHPKVSCPDCRVSFPRRSLKAVHALRNEVERIRGDQAARQGRRGDQCRQHGRPLTWFCETDMKAICAECGEGAAHPQHTLRAISDAVTVYKGELKESLDRLKEDEEVINRVQLKQKHNISEIEKVYASEMNHIEQDFTEMSQFLRAKEQRLVEELEEKKDEIVKRMELRLGEIQECLTSTGAEIVKREKQMEEQDNFIFLQEFSFLRQRPPEDFKAPGDISEDLSLEILKGPLQYSVWKELRDAIRPGPASLTLNPVTANPWLTLSEDLTSVRHGSEEQRFPDNPQRFDLCPCVLSSDGFTSGKHYWEVRVGNKTTWTVGVARESINRKGEIILSPSNGYWAVGLRNGSKYKAFTPSLTDLCLDMKPREIGVYLDYEGGQVSFYNAGDMSHLHTFSDTFTEKLFAFFSPGLNHGSKNAEPLQLLHSIVTNPNTEEDGTSSCPDLEREDATITTSKGNAVHLDRRVWQWAWLCFGLLVLLGAASPGNANFTEIYLVCCSMLGFVGLCWSLLDNKSLAGISWVYCGVLGYAGMCCLLLAHAGLVGICLVTLSLLGLCVASKSYIGPLCVVLSYASLVGLLWLLDNDIWMWWVCCGLLGHAGSCLSSLGYDNGAEICWWCCGTKGYVGLCLLLVSFYGLVGLCWITVGIIGLCLALTGYVRNHWITAGLLGYSGVWCVLVGNAELSAVTLGVASFSWSCWSYYSH
ncbi:E3 ubiquitin-protein ligase TRIM39-like [Heptranchias perlo]|uniref:E3 ubiquitin-protein ligase TRIM39-like n=1 Tax=Heptranchias perlo TaxID=212740 RepID=UPI0035598254